jgi:hypothetical protein
MGDFYFRQAVEQYSIDTEQSFDAVVAWLSKRPVEVSACLLGLGDANGRSPSRSVLREFQRWLAEQRCAHSQHLRSRQPYSA